MTSIANEYIPGDSTFPGLWLNDPIHHAFLRADAARQFAFFGKSLRDDGGFDVLDFAGCPLPRTPQELHTTTRLVHSFALGKATKGLVDPILADAIIDAGMNFLWNHHRDTEHGGYLWSVTKDEIGDGVKLAYGHVFVLLAASSAKLVGHVQADRLIADVAQVIDQHYWDEDQGLLRDEFNRDWTPFSTYRGMNANMHGIEAMLAAYEATGDRLWLTRAGRILDFFIGRIASAHNWRIPEHYHEDWTIDAAYQGNPMFRPAGSTPGHSFELGRLALQHWDLSGRPQTQAPAQARALIEAALKDAWLPEGGFAYTLTHQGQIGIPDRYWWPVTEAIGAMSSLLKLAPQPGDEEWYRRLWHFANDRLIDHDLGGWFPELGADSEPVAHQFLGKPDIYHAVQADLLPQAKGLSRLIEGLKKA